MTSKTQGSRHALSYEEWLLRYRENGQKRKLANGNSDKKHTRPTSSSLLMLARATCPVQAAMLEEEDEAANQLLDHSVREFDREFSMSSSFSKFSESSCKFPSLRLVNADDVDVDAFFEEYPECERPRNALGEADSEEEEEEEPADIVVIPANRPSPKVMSIYDGAPAQKVQRPSLSHVNQARTVPRANHQPPTHQTSALPVSQRPQIMNGPVRPPDPCAPGWDDVRRAQNPFQTAREFAHSGADQDDRPPDRPRRNQIPQLPQNPYAHHAYPQEPASAPVRGPSIPESLKRKFQPPKRNANEGPRNDSAGGDRKNGHVLSNGVGTVARPSSSSDKPDGDDLPEELKGLDKELVEKIQNEIMESGESVTFDDIAGLTDAKQTVQEVVCWPMKRPDLFTGLRRGPNGLLMFGPPGTGKTLIGKAIAHESGATFFSISSSSLTSKWIGEGEKLVRTLFAVAAYREPAVVFIDEIDSLLTQRKADENEASRRIKTEFLVQLDGTGTKGRVLVIGATNRPQELDDAARRRFVKRLYIPLPIREDRETLLRRLLSSNRNLLSDRDLVRLSEETDGYSGADLKSLAADAAMGPIRQLGVKALEVDPRDIPPISYKHFRQALRATTPSVARADLEQYTDWDSLYGSKSGHAVHDDDDESDGDT